MSHLETARGKAENFVVAPSHPADDPAQCMVVDDDPFVLDGLARAVAAIEGVDLVGAVGSLAEVLSHRGPVDVFLLDLSLPDACRRTVTRSVLDRWPDAGVLVLTAYATALDAVLAFGEGAAGYLIKGASAAEMADALHTVASGGDYFTPPLAGHLLNAGFELTPGESAVLRLVAEGLADKDVAEALGIARGTVENRIASVRAQAGLVSQSRSALTCLAHDFDPFCRLTRDQHRQLDRGRRRGRVATTANERGREGSSRRTGRSTG